MTEAFWWYLLAGFIVGFSVSTLWEWLYFRRRRMAIRDRRVAELEATVRTYAAAAPAPGANRAEDDWDEPGFQNPLVYLETEEIASSSTPVRDATSGTGAKPASGTVATAKNGVAAAQPVSYLSAASQPVTQPVTPAGEAVRPAAPTGAFAFQSLSVQPVPVIGEGAAPVSAAPGYVTTPVQTRSQGEASPAAVAALGAVALASAAVANSPEDAAPVAVVAPGAAEGEKVEPGAEAVTGVARATDAAGVNAGADAYAAAMATASRGALSPEAPSPEAPSPEAVAAFTATPATSTVAAYTDTYARADDGTGARTDTPAPSSIAASASAASAPAASASAPASSAPGAPAAPQSARELTAGEPAGGAAQDEGGAPARVTGLSEENPPTAEAQRPALPAAVAIGSSGAMLTAAGQSSEREAPPGASSAAATPMTPATAPMARTAASGEATPKEVVTSPAAASAMSTSATGAPAPERRAETAPADARRDAPQAAAPVAAAAVGAALLTGAADRDSKAAEVESAPPAEGSRQAPALAVGASDVTAASSGSAKPITSNELDALRLSIQELIENVSHDEAPAVASELTAAPQVDAEAARTDVYTTQVSGRAEYVLVRLVQSFVHFVRQVRAIVTGTDAARPEVRASQASTPQDDLTRITGLTPADAERLQMAGVTTYARLARLSAEELRLITLTPGRTASSASAYTQWPVEAAALAATQAYPS